MDVGEIVVGGVAGDRSESGSGVREKRVDGIGRHCYFSKHLLSGVGALVMGGSRDQTKGMAGVVVVVTTSGSN